MPSSYLNFRFRYLDEKGKPTSFFYHQALLDDSTGIRLDNEVIAIADIYDVLRYGDKIVLTLRPYLALPKEVAENIIPNTSSIIIEIGDKLAVDTKSAIDQHRTTYAAFLKKKAMAEEGKAHLFKMMQCPDCEAVIDLTGKKETPHIYCKYCELLFNRYGELMPKSESYKVCPECNYYNRVQYYPEFHFYALPKNRKIAYQEHYCCDTCAQRYHEQTAIKNSFFLIGIPFNIMLKNKMSKGVSELYEGLTRANRLAQDGHIKEADIIYSILLLRNETHPGLLFNIGQAYYKAEMLDKAYKYFEKSLDMCSNYQPTIDFLALHKTVSWKVKIN
ncbi:MAG: hypothetical protein EAZ08_11300 [Cytophagales bacterium]|nr:MAG: hypothetical protein EAZ08_11300 [Cytophagales bacterium]